jgi:hypothetical protein
LALDKGFRDLVARIKKINPDIIGVQEVNKRPHYIKKLSRAAGLTPFYHAGVGGVRLGSSGLPWNRYF